MELISFRFEMGEAPLLYSDALVMTQEAYDALTPEQITTLQQERYDRWLAIINTPPSESEIAVEPEVVPTEENI
jgi:hypothetical protein